MTSRPSTFLERLETFEGYWDDAVATARQLAALGHVFDRPPLAFLDEGSYCLTCGLFMLKTTSVLALEGALRSKDFIANKPFKFHNPGCERLQIRMPYDANGRDSRSDEEFEVSRKQHDSCESDDRADGAEEVPERRENHKCHLLALPVELRLQIYKFLRPFWANVMHLESVQGSSMEVKPFARDWSDDQRLAALEADIRMSDSAWLRESQALRLSLLTSCSQMHDEVLDLLYRNTMISSHDSKTLYLFLRQIGSRGRQALQKVDARCGFREDAIAYALLATCLRIRQTKLRLRENIYVHQKTSLWLTEGMASIKAMQGRDVSIWGDHMTWGHEFKYGQLDFKTIESRLMRDRERVSSTSL